MKYKVHEIDDFSFMQPRNLMTRKDERELFWLGLTVTVVAVSVVLVIAEWTGITNAIIDGI